MKAIRVSHTGGPEVMELVEIPLPQPKLSCLIPKTDRHRFILVDGAPCENSKRCQIVGFAD